MEQKTLTERYPGLTEDEAKAADAIMKTTRGDTRPGDYLQLVQAYSELFSAARSRIRLAEDINSIHLTIPERIAVEHNVVANKEPEVKGSGPVVFPPTEVNEGDSKNSQ